MTTGQCPWCGHGGERAQFWSTAEHADEAEFVYSANNEQTRARNPVMCPECHGVGGPEDFFDDGSTLADFADPEDDYADCAEWKHRI